MIDPILLTLITLIMTILAGFLATLRRCFTEIPRGLLHKRFSQWDLPRGFDEREKLQRVRIALMILSQVSRATWAALFLYWSLVNPWTGAALETMVQDLSTLTLVVAGGGLLLIAVVFFELIPQVISGVLGERISLAMLRPLCRVESLMSPLSGTFRSLRRALSRMVGNGKERTEAEVAEQSIRAAVELGQREGVLLEGEKSMIESLLEFHDAEVEEVMTPRTEMVCFEESLPIEEVVPQAIACGHSRIPVYRDNIDEITAVLYVKDLLRFLSDPQKRKVAVAKAARAANFVPETKKLSELLAEFRRERFHIAIVLDEYGGTAGLVTIEDIIEEIVGEIEDEYDPATLTQIRKVGDETFDLDGRAHVDDVSEAIGRELPESDDYETVAGFVFCSLGKVPKEGEEFEWENLRFRITSADERKIKRIRVQVMHPQSQDLE